MKKQYTGTTPLTRDNYSISNSELRRKILKVRNTPTNVTKQKRILSFLGDVQLNISPKESLNYLLKNFRVK